MKPLRPLAKDWNYRVTDDGWLFVRTGGPEIFTAIPYRSAPAECFSDEPAEEPPIRNGERVVVVDEPCVKMYGFGDDKYAGQHGVVCKEGGECVAVRLDGGLSRDTARKNLRHEREDERPAEKKPEPLRANFPPPQYRGGFPVLPIAEPKPEPPRKYEDGQHIKTMQTAVRGTIERAEWGFGDYGEWVYYLWPHNQGGDSRWTVQESACVPCPPPLTDAMKILCWRGTRVRRIEHPIGGDGKPYEKDANARKVGTVLGVDEVGLVRIVLDEGAVDTCYPWNLEPAEEK